MSIVLADCGVINNKRLYHIVYTDKIINYYEYIKNHL